MNSDCKPIPEIFSGEQSPWTPDILGNGFEKKYIVQPDDYSGPVCCTIVRLKAPVEAGKAAPEPKPGKIGVLYVHGFSDYFFQADMARRFTEHGYDFYAVDLRKYGRSILSGQKKFQVRNLAEYFPDIKAAITQMGIDGITDIVLAGHSTGGLTCSLMMATEVPMQVKALILNSPFFDWNLPSAARRIGIPIISWLGRFLPTLPIHQPKNTEYARCLSNRYNGEWKYNQKWKPDCMPDVDAGWIRAIYTAQKTLRNASPIEVPVLLLHSDRSVKKGAPSEEYMHGDAILDVDHISEAESYLGNNVTTVTVTGGMHDLALSRTQAREIFFREIFLWLQGQFL